jgi:hypothetical protein
MQQVMVLFPQSLSPTAAVPAEQPDASTPRCSKRLEMHLVSPFLMEERGDAAQKAVPLARLPGEEEVPATLVCSEYEVPVTSGLRLNDTPSVPASEEP